MSECVSHHEWNRLWWWSGRARVCIHCDRLSFKLPIRHSYDGGSFVRHEWHEMDSPYKVALLNVIAK